MDADTSRRTRCGAWVSGSAGVRTDDRREPAGRATTARPATLSRRGYGPTGSGVVTTVVPTTCGLSMVLVTVPFPALWPRTRTL